MKKFVVVLLALVLIGPATAYACDCWPSSNLNSSSPAYENSVRHCCPTLDVQKNGCGIEGTSELIPVSSNVLISPLFLALGSISIPALANPVVHGSGPPSFSSHTPLYLANRVLRL